MWQLLRLPLKILLYALLFLLLLIVAYRFVPVPITVTMASDPNGATRDWTSLDDISPDMVRAVIASEDSNFCTHDGFDREAIRKAWEENQQGGRVRGGSTISQQTAKNVFLWQGGGYFRKALEIPLAFAIEQVWGKRRIMEVYLNIAETGIGTYGVEAAAERYFKKDAADLSRIEAARIAVNLPQPKKRAVVNPGGWLARHGNRIAARTGVVQRDGLDACVFGGA